MTDEAIFTPGEVAVVRDARGEWWHPGIDWGHIPEGCPVDCYLHDMGFESRFRRMEDDAPDLYWRWRRGMQDCSAYTPSRPDGDGWFLAAIYRTEYGPLACWVRPIGQEPPA